jgi:hypothetical protein
MDTDVAKSFLATLTYRKGTNKYGSTNNTDLDFSYIDTETSSLQTPLYDRTRPVSKDTEYLCANTNAKEAAELYFRYETVGEGGHYRIWVRSGPRKGSLLAVSNNGYLYANTNYGRPHRFTLQVKTDTDWRPVTGNNMPSGQLLIQQADTGTQLTVQDSFKTPVSDDETMWWSYIISKAGSEERYISLNISQRNVDYAPSDVWGQGGA